MRRNLNAFFVVLFLFFGSANAADKKSSLTLSEARVLAPLKGTTVTAGYGIFKNTSDQTITLKVVSSKPFKAVELHETTEKDGKVGMNKVDQVVVPPHGSFELKPGSYHLMFFEPSRSIKTNEQLTVEFNENGKDVTFKFKIESREVDSSSDHKHH